MKKQNNAIIVTSIISGVILVIALVSLLVIAPSSSNGNNVNVQGVASVQAMPDLVGVYFSVETNGSTSSEASQENSEIVDAVVVELIRIGFERKDIVTENFNVYQDYDWTEEGRVDKGFRATHSISVKIDIEEKSLVGDSLDAAIDAGAGVSYINYELTQESQNKYKAEAMRLAAEDAKVKADSVAEGFGKRAGKLVSVQVNDFGYYPWRAYAGMDMMESASVKSIGTNIEPKEQEISATISATFKLR